VVTRELVLVAGERRVKACELLGWTHIPSQFVDEVHPLKLEAIELEENIKRQDLSWQDRTRAKERWHEIAKSFDPSWTPEQTAEELGVTVQSIGQHLSVAKAIRERPALAREETFSKVKGVVERENSRKADEERERLMYGHEIQFHDHTQDSILNVDFREWVKTYDGPRFNLLHCDFPYGINSDKFHQGATQIGTYEDTEDLYVELIRLLWTYQENLLAESCHLIFWFSMQYYDFTRKELSGLFDLDPFPLIWVKSDNAGISPDPSRGYRRMYETALFGTRGDRKIITTKSNSVFLPTTSSIHPHEKPVAVLEHFFSALVDGNTTLFDPTAGSGSSLRAAENLGAKLVFGTEKDPDFCRLANERIARERREREEEI
jgi:hypothetical protein